MGTLPEALPFSFHGFELDLLGGAQHHEPAVARESERLWGRLLPAHEHAGLVVPQPESVSTSHTEQRRGSRELESLDGTGIRLERSKQLAVRDAPDPNFGCQRSRQLRAVGRKRDRAHGNVTE